MSTSPGSRTEINKATILSDFVIIPFAKASSRRPLILGFRELRDLGVQARLKGWVALVPDVDLDAYSFRAVIDWIEMGLGLQAPQQFMQLQKVLGARARRAGAGCRGASRIRLSQRQPEAFMQGVVVQEGGWAGRRSSGG